MSLRPDEHSRRSRSKSPGRTRERSRSRSHTDSHSHSHVQQRAEGPGQHYAAQEYAPAYEARQPIVYPT